MYEDLYTTHTILMIILCIKLEIKRKLLKYKEKENNYYV